MTKEKSGSIKKESELRYDSIEGPAFEPCITPTGSGMTKGKLRPPKD